MNELEEFLRKYLDNFELDFEDTFENMARYMCENYMYNPKDKRLTAIAFGYFLAKEDEASANAQSGLLTIKMDEIYKVVAKENNWE
jgi:hypothetical protein